MRTGVAAGRLILAGVLVLAGSCSSGDLGSREPSGLPTATATLHWATLSLPRGSYCWNSGGHGVCADSAPVDVLLRTGYLKPHGTAGGYRVQIAFRSGSALIRSEIRLLTAPTGSSGAVEEPAPLAFDLLVIPARGAGVYVYVVTGTWSEGSVSFFLALDEIPGGA